jgi:hypothetical protein
MPTSLQLTGARLVLVSVTSDEGLGRGRLEQALKRTSPAIGLPDADYNPPGACLRTEERMLVLARRQGVDRRERDHGELAIDRPGTPAPLAACGAAVTVGSVGKGGLGRSAYQVGGS